MEDTISVDLFPKGTPGYAMQLRLTPEILAAIRGGGQTCIRLTPDQRQAIVTVDGKDFPFKALPQEGCKLLTLHGDSTSQCVADIMTKLQPSRLLPDRLLPGATTLLNPVPALLKVPKVKTQVVSLDKPVQITSKLPQHPDPPSRTPSSGPASSREEHTPASMGRGASSSSTLRQAILWILSQRPAVKKSIRTRLASTDIPGGPLTYTDGELERIIKEVATYKPPGMYVLKPDLAGEIENWCLETKRARIDLDSGAPINRQCDTPSAPSMTGNESDDGLVSVGTKRLLPRPLSAGSRGSEDADESWVLEHTGRKPLAPPPIQSEEEHAACEAEFKRKYELYFRLHQLIAANRKDFEALTQTLDAAATDADKERLEGEVKSLWDRRSSRAKQWKAAFDVLHQELTAMKARMAEFSDAHDDDDDSEPESHVVSESESE